ncbi:MAG TPA: molybdopterin molybdotransferase MoeA [Fulvivirga sp.]|nr:molybdopterin molybdotransferase MoeA [Fulvivirga sp.]
MITVEEASSIIQSNLFKPREISVPLDQCNGMTLAEPIHADRDFPPFDRVMMDGVAIASKSFYSDQRNFTIEGVQMAGMPQLTLNDPSKCIEVMTGAVLPKNTDAVIRYEDVTIENRVVSINSDTVESMQNVHLQGMDSAKDTVLIRNGTKISTAEIGILATVGKGEVMVYAPPKVAIVSTGDELVSVREIPKEYQIRQSNSHVLKAALMGMGIEATIFHIIDEQAQMNKAMDKIFTEHDVMILSGGVSKGRKDFVPEVLNELGVKKLFHGVKQRPGKPFWFGTREDNKTVFALPGNPVSTFMCFYKYIKPWINASLLVKEKAEFGILNEGFTFDKPMTYFLQVKVSNVDGQLIATPVQGQGSGDLGNLLLADGFLELEQTVSNFSKGKVFPFIRYRSA